MGLVRSVFIAMAVLGLSAISQGADLLNSTSLMGPTAGLSCRVVVTRAISKFAGQKVEVLSYENLTPGSYNQEYLAKVRMNGIIRQVELTGQFDCDSLRVKSIR